MADNTTSFHPNQAKIQKIIADVKPGGDITVQKRLNTTYNIAAQQERENDFYEALYNPIDGTQVTNIQQLNKLIKDIDKIENYNLGSLLPGGKIEQDILEKWNLNESSKTLNDIEIKQINMYLKELSEQAVQIIYDQTPHIAEIYKNNLLSRILTMMGDITINTSTPAIFTSKSIQKKEISDFIYYSNSDYSFEMDKHFKEKQSQVITFKIEKFFDKNQFTYSENGKITGLDISSSMNLNKISNIEELRQWAIKNGIISEREIKEDKDDNRLIASEHKEDFYQEVYDTICNNLSLNGRNISQKIIFSTLEKYGITNPNTWGKNSKGRENDRLTFNTGFQTFRGALGELRSILVVAIICPSASKALIGESTIGLKNSTTLLKNGGEQAPLDLIVQLGKVLNIGIQVKNTQEINYSWHGDMRIPNFYKERLQANMDQSETDFFGAYIYNQPTDEDDGSYLKIYNTFESKFEEFYSIYKRLYMFIIRQMTEATGSKDNLLQQIINASEGNILRNDFFIIGEQIFPTSALYQSLNDSNNITSSFKFKKTNNEGFYTSQHPIPNNYSTYANSVTIYYSITPRVNNLITSAFNF